MRRKRKRGDPRRQTRVDLLDATPTLELDLHGHTALEAARVVRNFIATASRTRSGEVVRIITGKGLRSANGSVLLPTVKRLLTGELRGYVAEFDLDLDVAGYLVRLK